MRRKENLELLVIGEHELQQEAILVYRDIGADPNGRQRDLCSFWVIRRTAEQFKQ